MSKKRTQAALIFHSIWGTLSWVEYRRTKLSGAAPYYQFVIFLKEKSLAQVGPRVFPSIPISSNPVEQDDPPSFIVFLSVP